MSARHLTAAFLLLSLSTVAAPLAAKTAAPVDRIAQAERWFVDELERVVILRGGNVTLPALDPAKPTDPRWSPDTPRRMAEQGFNSVRLVIFFSGVMPKPGVLDEGYIDRIGRVVAAYKAAGIHVMIDFHQDQYGALVGVRGMPDWAVFSDGHNRMPGVEFPVGYFRDPAVQRSFDNFWANHPVPGTGKGVQDLYVDGLAAVARRFRDEPAVIGIDVMNEPATGSLCAQPDPVQSNCPELEERLLRPFYEKAAAAIGRAAPKMIVFTEPFMLQGALGTPINTPITGAAGRRGFSFHNYGPVKATRDRVNDGATAHAIRSKAAIINTEWGFSNDPLEIRSQAADFDSRHISWLAWTRGAFEALVDPSLPDRGNGNRMALLRAYARPYPQATAGTPLSLEFDGDRGVLTYRYSTTSPTGRKLRSNETEIRIPPANFPAGYRVTVAGGTVSSAAGSALVRIRNQSGARYVVVTISRVGDLPPVAALPDRRDDPLRDLPPIPPGPLTRASLLGHIVGTEGGRAVLDREVPGMLTGMSHVHGWAKMTLSGVQQFAPAVLTAEKLASIDAELAKLDVRPGPLRAAAEEVLSIDSLVSDLLADPRARAVLEREVPGLATSHQQGLFPQTRLRNLQPVMPEILTKDALTRVEAALETLR